MSDDLDDRPLVVYNMTPVGRVIRHLKELAYRKRNESNDEEYNRLYELSERVEEAVAVVIASFAAHRTRPVGELNLSVRAENVLKAMGVVTCHDLSQASVADLRDQPQCGETTVAEIIERAAYGGVELRKFRSTTEATI